MRGTRCAALSLLLTWLSPVGASLTASPALANGGEVRGVLRALADRASAQGAARVIVQLDVAALPEGRLRTAAARRLQRQRIASAQGILAGELVGTAHRVTRSFRSIPFVALEVGADALAALERSPRVVAVQEDRLHRPSLDVSIPLVEADQAIAMGFDGTGQTVVVLDTGVDAAHPNLNGKVVAEACFASGKPFGSGDCPNGQTFDAGSGSGSYCTYSGDCFHATHVAGIAVGAGASFPGAAQGATLIPIQVFSEFNGSDCAPGPSPCPLSYTSDQIAALEYVFNTLRPLHSIASVNMSLGGVAYTSQSACDAANPGTKVVIDNLRSVGIATVIAAGNDGFLNRIGEPACISSAVSVSATDDADAIPIFANAASFLSLWAPGVDIRAPFYQTTGYVEASGTSMATPHVAGAWAILRQAAPTASVDEVLLALQQTGLPIADAFADTSRIRIAQALAELLPACRDGADDDGDGFVDFPEDPGCADADDPSENDPALACDDGADNDGDGLADFPADPGCKLPTWFKEDPQCDDDVDNDGDGGIDWDGGGGGGAADPQCVGQSWRNLERKKGPKSRCGLGFELALLLPALLWLRAARRRVRATFEPV